MTAVIPDVQPDARFGAGEAAKLLGISRETFRRFVNDGRIRKRYRKYSSRPYYLGRDIQTLWRY